jgi:hypothetical protein
LLSFAGVLFFELQV